MKKDTFFIESFTNNFYRKIKIDKIYFEGKTVHQFVQCIHNQIFGKMIFLDKQVQSAEIDEHIYHESLVHPALFTHRDPKKVLIAGGGEGATLREVLRHKHIDKAVMVDIDGEMVDICKKYLPEWSQGAFEHPKTRIVIGDARAFIKNTEERFDVIISDLTEPVQGGPSIYLFTREYFEEVFGSLHKEGIFVLQAGSADPYYHHFFASCYQTLREVFPFVRPYWIFVFSFGLPWGFVMASKKHDPVDLNERIIIERLEKRQVMGLRSYNPAFHKGMFAMPLDLQESLGKGTILTDANPFIWET